MHVYETKHIVAHSAEEMFALVAQVEDYPKFLPLCEELKVKHREQRNGKEVLVATMTVGYGMIHESFTTGVHLDNSNRTILVEYLDGPFTFLENRWQFQPQGGGLARSISTSPMHSARGCSSVWSAACSPRPWRNIPAPSRPAPTRSMARKSSRLPHSTERSIFSACATPSRWISVRPGLPNSTPSLATGPSRRPAAK